MNAWATVATAAAVGAVALLSRRLAPTPVSGPMVLVAAGVLSGPVGLDLIDVTRDAEAVRLLLEAALVLVLFTDAFSVRARDLRRDDALPVRLLVFGLPMTMVLGALAGWALLPGRSGWELALLAVVLAPTDAALGQPAIADPRVPRPVRQGLNVESGLNDGIALPFFVVLLAAAGGGAADGPVEVFLRALGVSTAVGVAAGWLGAVVLARCTARGWVAGDGRIVPVAVVVLGYAVTVSLDGSGFITAWVAGLAFGTVWRRRAPRPDLDHGRPDRDGPDGVVAFGEQLGGLLAALSFLVFGAVLLGPAVSRLGVREVLYAVLSLTVVRMLPVAVALLGSRFRLPTVLYVGWFGPRGLASIVFGLILLQEGSTRAGALVDVVAGTVGLSVLLHGATAAVAARAYGRWHSSAYAVDPDLREGAPTSRPS